MPWKLRCEHQYAKPPMWSMCPCEMAQNLAARADLGEKPISKQTSISGILIVVASPATE